MGQVKVTVVEKPEFTPIKLVIEVTISSRGEVNNIVKEFEDGNLMYGLSYSDLLYEIAEEVKNKVEDL